MTLNQFREFRIMTVFIACLICIILSATQTNSGLFIDLSLNAFPNHLHSEDYLSHDPIVIASDNDLLIQSWPGNGTSENPFVMNGLNITTSGTCISISNTRSHIVLKNSILSSDSADGVYLSNVTNVYTENCTIDNRVRGIRIIMSSNCIINNSHIMNSYDGIVISQSNDTRIINSSISNCLDGVGLYTGSSYSIITTVVENCKYGVYIRDSNNASFYRNVITANQKSGLSICNSNSCLIYENEFSTTGMGMEACKTCNITDNVFSESGIFISGYVLTQFFHTFENNSVNGKPLAVLHSISNVVLSASSYGEILLVNCSGIEVIDSTPIDSFLGVQLAYSSFCSIRNTSAMYGGYVLVNSFNCSIDECRADFGVLSLDSSYNCSIMHSIGNNSGFNIHNSQNLYLYDNIAHNSDFDIDESSTCRLEFNKANYGGFSISESYDCIVTNNQAFDGSGFFIDMTRNSVFDSNIAVRCSTGFDIFRTVHCSFVNVTSDDNGWYGFYLRSSRDCSIINSSIQNNHGRGIRFDEFCFANLMYGNTIAWNVYLNAYDDGFVNEWDNGISIGNKWGDHFYSGSYHIEGDGDAVDHYAGKADTELPTINSPSNRTIESGSTGDSITWSPRDEHPHSYRVYKNGSEITADSWDGTDISISIDSLELGSIEYKLRAYDTCGNYVEDIVSVLVIDSTKPIPNTPQDITYQEFSGGHSITWQVNERYPDSYIVYRNGTNVQEGKLERWQDVFRNVNNLPLGAYNYTVFVNDSSGNWATDTVWVFVYDGTLPIVDSPMDIEFEYGENGYNITWHAFDLHPTIYEVFRNGDLIESNPWNISEAICIQLDSLEEGEYNFTILFYDVEPNVAFDTIIVTIYESLPPIISGPNDFVVEENSLHSQEYIIQWNVTDLSPFSYQILVNGTQIVSAEWNTSEISVSIGIGQPLGVYNYTLILIDRAGNQAQNSVFVNIFDGTKPEINHPEDILIQQGELGRTLIWTVYDYHLHNYLVLRNGTPWSSGLCNDTECVITVSVDGHNLGTYNYTIVVTDVGGNTATDTVLVIVTDGTPPTIDSPLDIEYEEGQTGNVIVWNPDDLHPAIYEIVKDEDILLSDDWVSTCEPISISVDGLSPGVYNYTIVVTDVGGNTATDTVIVTVTALTTTTSSTTPSPPPPGGDILTVVIVIVSTGAAVMVVSIILVKKRK